MSLKHVKNTFFFNRKKTIIINFIKNSYILHVSKKIKHMSLLQIELKKIPST